MLVVWPVGFGVSQCFCPQVQMPPAGKSKEKPPSLSGHLFKQYPGPEQVELRVKVDIPGSWFSSGGEGQLSATERREKYEAVAVEYESAHIFQPALGKRKAQLGPAIRFLCHSDAADDADHRGYWIELPLWNRYRNDTYKDRRGDEVRRATLTLCLPRPAQPLRTQSCVLTGACP